ncbi:MAG: DNA mismatch repair endonuclease MutL [Proteobacteria bacterium]|nr:DNA mismatch repair endonuclease MutL [Desulfobacula sp.]MBU4129939.1 DNA mismatch repair endonuclease MutL [Pseudomonadota bacterium]
MAKIRILPEILSNQIAAGEVVQRPASVVKELVENSIDAGATRITVEIEKGGKSLIRISDDGCGLARDEALLSIERYATSKIFTKEDLFSISTFGFRGEALPSIASVSRFCLVSRTSASDIGTKIEMTGGKLVRVSDEGAPCGTLVEVKHLFFNTPARQKFLKGESTEAGHIADAVSGLALGNPCVGFRLFLNKRLVKNFPPGQDLFQRSLMVLGNDAVNQIYPINGLEGMVSVTGVCANPGVTRSTSNRIYLFVNNRLVYDRGVVAAVFAGYRGRIMKGRFPMGVICVKLPYDQVDVNVHPSKREVKFLLPGPVYQAVGQAVGNALEKAQTNVLAYAKGSGKLTAVNQGRKGIESLDPVEKEPSFALPRQWFETPQPPQVAQTVMDWNTTTRDRQAENKTESAFVPPGLTAFGPAAQMRVLGQVMGTYIVAEKDNSLVLIDQHAAHERVVYEALKKRHKTLDVQSQDLLVPEVLDLTHREADVLLTILGELSDMGLRIEPFGGTCFVIKAIPSLLDEKNLKFLVLEIIETLMEGQSLKDGWRDSALISMACHGAIRANKPMNIREMTRLLEDLERCDTPLHCPHGRPTLIAFDSVQMQKLFKRLV